MRYTPEELYTWSLQEGYKEDLIAGQYYNKSGFAARLVQGQLLLQDNQYYYDVKLSNGLEFHEPIGRGSEEENAVLAKVQEHPEIMRVCVVSYEKKYYLRIVFGETEEERIEKMDQIIITDMFRLMEIDTQGKLKKFLEEVKVQKANKQAWNMIAQGMKKKYDKLKKEQK